MDKPDYIKSLESQVRSLNKSHEEMKNNREADKEVHAEILKSLKSIDGKTTSIDHTLSGTKQDPGGLVEEVHSNTENVQSIKRNQAKRDGITISFSAFSALLISALGWLIGK